MEVDGRQEGELLREHNGGQGGWPTIKYFNKETGIQGQKYSQKTSKRVCEELGEQSYMQAFVEEAGNTKLKGGGTDPDL